MTRHLEQNRTINLIVRHDEELNHYYDKLYPGQLNVLPGTNFGSTPDYHPLLSMNPLVVKTHSNTLEAFKQHVISALGAANRTEVPRILLIERDRNEHGIKIGANRRSLTNHREPENFIRHRASSSYEFMNVKLENLTLKEQVQLFDHTVLVIAQHGAGLANCLWMKPDTEIVELSGAFLNRHFLNLVKLKDIAHNHFRLEKNMQKWISRNSRK